jgi:acyl-coenzyme A thioesterase PaaI-like protein
VSRWVERIAEFKRTGDPSGMTDAIPYAGSLGIRLELSDGEVIGHMPFAPHLVGNPRLPALHGGTLGALLESTAIFKLMWEADTVVLPKIVSITVDFLRSGRPLDTYARGIITKQGRRVVNVRAEAWQLEPHRPIAIAHAHFLIRPASEA